MTDVQAHIRALAALKRSEAYERAGDYENAYREGLAAQSWAKQWNDSLWNRMALASQEKAA